MRRASSRRTNPPSGPAPNELVAAHARSRRRRRRGRLRRAVRRRLLRGVSRRARPARPRACARSGCATASRSRTWTTTSSPSAAPSSTTSRRASTATRLAAEPDPSTDLVGSLHAAATDPANHITERTAIATIRQMIVAGMARAPSGAGQLRRPPRAGRRPADSTCVGIRRTCPRRSRNSCAYTPRTACSRARRRKTPWCTAGWCANRAGRARLPLGESGRRGLRRPDEFVLHRKNNSHLAFGRGAAQLPRRDDGPRRAARRALQTLLARTASFRARRRGADDELARVRPARRPPRSRAADVA